MADAAGEQMLRRRRIPGLSGSTLKLIALITMIIDHVGAHLLQSIPECNTVWLTISEFSCSWYSVSRLIGRTAFPIYCFLIAEGAVHTHSRKQYGINLAVFALISEIPWNLEHNNTIFLPGSQSVYVTLLLGFLGICALDWFRTSPWGSILALTGIYTAALLLHADYGAHGVGLILLLYALREKRLAACTVGVCLSEAKWKGIPAFLLIGLYNGERGFIRGKLVKYLFYAAYPAHIMVLWYLKYEVLAK